MSKRESKARPPRPRREPLEANYPPRPAAKAAEPLDSSRRRFLAQIGCGAGGLGVLAATGLPRLAHGQSLEVDFSLLEAHPTTESLAPPTTPAEAPADAMSAAPVQPMAAAPPAPAPPAEPVELVTENRALWIEPGYLLLVRWERPTEDAELVAAFEGSTAALSEYLSTHVTEMDDLHDLEQLHVHEHALANVLRARVSPAKVEVLHLDHDCSQVCGSLGWSGHDPEPIPLPGVPPSPGFP